MMLQYALGRELSADVDVFSVGILFLEMFTGNGPKIEMVKDSTNLHNFVKSAALPARVIEIVGPQLLRERLGVQALPGQSNTIRNEKIEDLIQIFKQQLLALPNCLENK